MKKGIAVLLLVCALLCTSCTAKKTDPVATPSQTATPEPTQTEQVEQAEPSALASVNTVDFGAVFLRLSRDHTLLSAARNDCDLDGELELLAMVEDEYGQVSCVIFESGSMAATAYTRTGAAQDIDFKLDPSTGCVIFHEGYYTVGTHTEGFYAWDGAKWSQFGDIGYSDGQFQEATLHGRSVSEEAFLQMREQLASIASLSAPDLLNIAVEGDADQIIEAYTALAKTRDGYVDCARGDLDGDGVEECAFVYNALTKPWIEGMAFDNEGGSTIDVYAAGCRADVVIADPAENGVVFRCCDAPLQDLDEISVLACAVEGGLLVCETPFGLFRFVYTDVENTLTAPSLVFKDVTESGIGAAQDVPTTDISEITGMRELLLSMPYWHYFADDFAHCSYTSFREDGTAHICVYDYAQPDDEDSEYVLWEYDVAYEILPGRSCKILFDYAAGEPGGGVVLNYILDEGALMGDAQLYPSEYPLEMGDIPL